MTVLFNLSLELAVEGISVGNGLLHIGLEFRPFQEREHSQKQVMEPSAFAPSSANISYSGSTFVNGGRLDVSLVIAHNGNLFGFWIIQSL